MPRLAQVSILEILSQASYHAPYDHCTSKFLTAAGVPHDFVKLVDLGILGNGHIMYDEKNNLDIAKVVEDWLRERGGHLRAEQFSGIAGPRLEFDAATVPCLAH